MKNKKNSAYIIEIEQSEKETGKTMYNTRHELAKLITHIEQLENNRDKAIEYVESHFIFNDKTGECYQTHTFDKDNVKKLYDILKGDSE